MVITIRGDRKCRNCGGICHKGSYRDKIGKRKSYYCGLHCLILSLNKNARGLGSNTDFVDQHYERVDVATQ